VFFTTLLRVVFDGTAPDLGVLHVFEDGFVDFVAKVGDGGVEALHDHGFAVVGHFSLGFGVDSDEVESVPDHVLEAVEVPLLECTDRADVLGLAEQVQFLQTQPVHFVQHLQTRNLFAVALDGVNQTVHVETLLHERHVAVVPLLLSQDRLDQVVRQVFVGLAAADD